MNKKQTLKNLMLNKQIEPFIRHIRFPFFKNLSEGTRIDFCYPITVLVGQNGTNKSSVLKALYGSPNKYSIGSLWFSTAVDEIKDDGRSRFIYGYNDDQTRSTVEVIKTRISSSADPDYWEPSRPIISDGMAPMPPKVVSQNQLKTRWKAIDKNVVYLDFRASISAFDKFFHHSDYDHQTKKEYLRNRSVKLKYIIENNLQKYRPYKGKQDKLFENKILSNEKTKVISEILGRNYKEIRIIEHSLFTKNRSKTIILQSESLNYSEAFAGSGEFSVAILVDSLLDCVNSSLILLDEPEVSLHPLAQTKLMNFISDQIIKKKHQVVISTHSSSIVRDLPNEAIKLFCLNESISRVEVLQNVSPEEAFFILGDQFGKKTIIVEDKLAKKFVEKSLKTESDALLNTFEVKYFPGGATSLYQNLALPLSIANAKDILFLLDGDQKIKGDVESSKNIPESKNEKLSEIVKNMINIDIKFHCDGGPGGSNKQQKIEQQRRFIDFIHDRIGFLPIENPETFLIENLSENEKKHVISNNLSSAQPKEITCELCKLDIGEENITSLDIFETQKRILSRIPKDNPAFSETTKLLQEFLKHDKIR